MADILDDENGWQRQFLKCTIHFNLVSAGWMVSGDFNVNFYQKRVIYIIGIYIYAELIFHRRTRKKS